MIHFSLSEKPTHNPSKSSNEKPSKNSLYFLQQNPTFQKLNSLRKFSLIKNDLVRKKTILKEK